MSTNNQEVDQKQTIQDHGYERKYFFIMLNMADDSDLDPYEFRLLAHYKRVVGEKGKCSESVTTTAKCCSMSRTSVIRARRSLASKGWINVTGGEPKTLTTCKIRIVDKMPENISRYAGKQGSTYLDYPSSDMDSKKNKDKNKNKVFKTSDSKTNRSQNQKNLENPVFARFEASGTTTTTTNSRTKKPKASLPRKKLSGIMTNTRDKPLAVVYESLLAEVGDKTFAKNKTVDEAVYRIKSSVGDRLSNAGQIPFLFGLLKRAYRMHLSQAGGDFDEAFSASCFGWLQLGKVPVPKDWDGEANSLQRWHSKWFLGNGDKRMVGDWVVVWRDWKAKTRAESEPEPEPEGPLPDWLRAELSGSLKVIL